MRFINDTTGKLKLQDFIHAVNNGDTPDNETMLFFAEAFSKILAGIPAPKALQLSRKGRLPPNPSQAAKRIGIVEKVMGLMSQGLTRDDAIIQIAEETFKSEKQIRRYYDKWKPVIEHFQTLPTPLDMK